MREGGGRLWRGQASTQLRARRYVLISAQAPGKEQAWLLVRGDNSCEYHADVLDVALSEAEVKAASLGTWQSSLLLCSWGRCQLPSRCPPQTSDALVAAAWSTGQRGGRYTSTATLNSLAWRITNKPWSSAGHTSERTIRSPPVMRATELGKLPSSTDARCAFVHLDSSHSSVLGYSRRKFGIVPLGLGLMLC